MVSPGTGNMVVSMYYPIFEGEKCIGYVGGAVYAKRLMDSLLELELKSLPNNNSTGRANYNACSYNRLKNFRSTILYHKYHTLLQMLLALQHDKEIL